MLIPSGQKSVAFLHCNSVFMCLKAKRNYGICVLRSSTGGTNLINNGPTLKKTIAVCNILIYNVLTCIAFVPANRDYHYQIKGPHLAVGWIDHELLPRKNSLT